VDVGFRKTGIAVFRIHPMGDPLIAAHTVCPKEPGQSVLYSDVVSCFAMIDGILEFLDKHEVQALFLEFPSGGSQSGRASRCMGMATGVASGILKMAEWKMGYELYTPRQIEELLGIVKKPAKKGQKQRSFQRLEKKAALARIAQDSFPDFDGWPGKAALAEDSYDAACAFIAARRSEDGLYHRIRAHVAGRAHR
jgi:hypothetical protein